MQGIRRNMVLQNYLESIGHGGIHNPSIILESEYDLKITEMVRVNRMVT